MTTVPDPAFLDANILIYAADLSAAHYSACQALLQRGMAGTERLIVSPQILSEFIAVVTNPNVMPSPLPAASAYAHVEKLARAFDVITAPPEVVNRFVDLLRTTGISGKRSHDVLHAATMLENGVTRIYTFDAGFASIPGITVLRP